MTWPNIGIEAIGYFLQASLLLAIPLILASLGEAISERAGIYNVGLEGYMLTAAFTSFAITYTTGNHWLAILGGIFVAMLTSILHAYFSIILATDQIVSGIGINMFVSGLTSLWYRQIVIPGQLSIPPLPSIEIPVLGQIPIIGPMFFRHSILVYVGYCLIPLCSIFLYRTAFGLKVRGVGEDPLVSESMGVRVQFVRFISIIICGVLAGLSGVFITLGYVHMFFDNIIAGRGFIALALVVVGGWDPIKIFLGSLIFGGIYSFQYRIQAIYGTYAGIPYPFMLMLPYILTLIVLFWAKRMKIAPKALAVPYKRKK